MAMAGLIEGERPPRPAHPSFTPELWELMQRCWDQNPYLRPEISEVLGVLTGLSVRRSLSGNVVYRPDHFIMCRDSPSSSNPLQRLHCLEKSSPQFPDQLTSLLSEKEYKDYTSGLRGEDLVWLVDFLDDVCLDTTISHSILMRSAGS